MIERTMVYAGKEGRVEDDSALSSPGDWKAVNTSHQAEAGLCWCRTGYGQTVDMPKLM